nr:hypothetical protein [Tanacetum cinerariifolium]
RPKTLDDAIELANDLMDQKLHTYAEIQAENKRKLDNNHQAQQQLLKKQNVAQAYAVGTGEKKSYGGSKPLCPKCNYHHDRECAPKSDCPVLKNQGTKARGMVYALEEEKPIKTLTTRRIISMLRLYPFRNSRCSFYLNFCCTVRMISN